MTKLLQKAETYTHFNDRHNTFFTVVGSEETGYTVTFRRKDQWGDYRDVLTIGTFIDLDSDRTPKKSNHVFKTLEMVEEAIKANPGGYADGKRDDYYIASMRISHESRTR